MDLDNVISVHTPSSSLALFHSGVDICLSQVLHTCPSHRSTVTADSLTSLFKKLTRKQYSGKRVGPGWLKYRWSGIVWNLDNSVFQCIFILVNFTEPSTDEDYTIFQWRKNGSTDPTIYLKDPSEPLPSQSLYRNRSFYLFHPDHTVPVQPSLDIQSKRAARSCFRSCFNFMGHCQRLH